MWGRLSTCGRLSIGLVRGGLTTRRRLTTCPTSRIEPLLKLVITLAGIASFVSAQAPPNLLRQALQGLPGVSVLDAPIDAKSLADLKQGGYWPPWSMADLDGDGSPDVAAVVVKGLGASRTFGVIAVHARTPGTIQWVVPIGKASITGLTTKQPPNSVMPLFCFYCDSNTYFRWSGTA